MSFAPQVVILQSGETLVNFDHLLSHQAWCDKTTHDISFYPVREWQNKLKY